MSSKYRNLCLAIGLYCAIGCGNSSAAIVTNGGFETGDFTGWTVSPNNGFPFIFVSTGPFTDAVTMNPYEGNSFAALGWNTEITGIGTLSQTLTTVAGQEYAVSFAYLAENGTPNGFEADFGSTTLVSYTNDTSNTTNPATWTYATYLATATSNSTVLSFTAYNNPFYDALDAVSVQAVPEPATMVIWGIGALGFGLVAARRRKLAAK